ncbi:MAG: glutamate-5-semialdehyde dehydrogenase [Alphaproteobacteria bacterium]|nr:glutamate-5-semialdehyde dehydrogenase [Alphaproteobacteria bacterium]MBU0798458.1 glutamate-5-semialdehyde dehydrogenase [Alphaproteobacteria bacterium]MBU0888416.1 glutamate-5-semialdehyde dehydrogenase [Alphaproteobacteria bacterium]MBU1814727.1 glutamate-5-semialdehyde dehydrogenase [Alphaproteobacteria bacterium]
MATPDEVAALAMQRIGAAARAAAAELALAPAEVKNQALLQAAAALRASAGDIQAANERDMQAGEEKGLTRALLDRLMLDEARIEAIAQGLEDVAAQPDPVGRILADWQQPNGLKISRIAVPLGVIGIIYESRPNVTADAGGLCLKAGNAAILRGGSESFHSSNAIIQALRAGLVAAGLPEAAIQSMPSTDRALVGEMLRAAGLIDVIVPRGGRGLIERVMNESRVPVMAHLDGLCHVYVDGDADPKKARRITFNSKMRRPGVCGAAETLLVDARAMAGMLPAILDDLITEGCEVRGDPAVCGLDPRVSPATEADWTTEYLDAIISVKIVNGVEGAIRHINNYGSHHTDSIITENQESAERFLAGIDSAIVLHNASTQFADGGEFGMGAEIGISTGKLHARGPVGAEQLTTYKYVVRGTGQVRP